MRADVCDVDLQQDRRALPRQVATPRHPAAPPARAAARARPTHPCERLARRQARDPGVRHSQRGDRLQGSSVHGDGVGASASTPRSRSQRDRATRTSRRHLSCVRTAPAAGRPARSPGPPARESRLCRRDRSRRDRPAPTPRARAARSTRTRSTRSSPVRSSPRTTRSSAAIAASGPVSRCGASSSHVCVEAATSVSGPRANRPAPSTSTWAANSPEPRVPAGTPRIRPPASVAVPARAMPAPVSARRGGPANPERCTSARRRAAARRARDRSCQTSGQG